MKIGCLIYYFGKIYDKIGPIALRSFKKWHPDVTLHHVNNKNGDKYYSTNLLDEFGHGVYKYMLAAEIMKKENYDKMIILGADTITCARLTEFIDDNDHDVLATLDYPYQLVDEGLVACPSDEHHINADVVCFNSHKPIYDIIKQSFRFKNYAEQGGLNYVAWSGLFPHTGLVVDSPYATSKVVYNVRSKGNMCLPFEYQDHSLTTGVQPMFPPYEKPWGPYLNKFYVKDNALYTSDNKQIKVWHYCEGFGGLSEENFVKLVNNYINKWFNIETKQFFKNHCQSEDFFEKRFVL